MKLFVEEATKETLKLERALASLRTERRVVLLHYAPIAATVVGEPLEIHPFLGSSRLEEPLDRYHVDLTFHGHAHKGSTEGRTRGGRPVYNVALPLLRENGPGLPLLVVDLDAIEEATPRRDDSFASTT
jgi:Icc-related predicted phosphoesterase